MQRRVAAAALCLVFSVQYALAFVQPPPPPTPPSTCRSRPPPHALLAVSGIMADGGTDDGSARSRQLQQQQQQKQRRRPPPPPPRARTPLFSPQDLTELRERIRTGTHLAKAAQDLRLWRLAEAGQSPVPDALYQEVLRHCRHAQPPRAYMTRALGMAQEVAMGYLSDALASGSPTLPLAEVRGVLQASSRAGDADGALALLRFLIGQAAERGGQAGPAASYLDEFQFFLVVKCCCADGGSAGARNTKALAAVGPLLAEMDELGIAKSSFLYSAAFKAFGRMGWRERVEALADEMLARRDAVRPDLIAMNSLLDALARCGNVARAQQVLGEMRTTSEPRPDVYSYNTLLRALGQQSQTLPQALSLYRDMQQAQVQPDAITINTLVTACTRAGNLGRALLILESSSVPASVEGYSALLGGLAARGDVAKAQEVLDKMQAAGMTPNVRTYTALLQGAALAGDMERVSDVFKRMKEQGQIDPSVRPTVWTYNALLTALAKNGQVQAMLSLKDDMVAAAAAEKDGVRPDIVTCNIVLDALLFKTDPPCMREAETLFLEMLEEGPYPDQYTFSTLLRAYRLPGALLGDDTRRDQDDLFGAAPPRPASDILPGPDRLLELMGMRHDMGLLLDTTAVNSLLLAYVKAGALKRSLEVFHDFKLGNLTASASEVGRGGKPDVVTYTILIKGVAASDNMYAGAKIMQLYREMREEYGIAPDLQLAYALVNSFVRARSRVAGLDMEDMEELLADLKSLGWRQETLARLEARASSYVGLFSEAWKENRGSRRGGRDRRQQPESTSDRLFQKYGWNTMDSGYNFF